MTTQNNLKIIVEGINDAQLIRVILGDARAKKSSFYAAQGRISLATLGRNLLFHEGGPVLLVMDSDTLSPQLAAEMQSMNVAAMSGSLMSGGQLSVLTAPFTSQFKVFTFIPEIEVVFFEAPEALDRLLGEKTSQEKIKEGRFIPKKVLTELLANAKARRDYHAILEHLDPKAQQALAAGPQASSLKATVESLLADAA